MSFLESCASCRHWMNVMHSHTVRFEAYLSLSPECWNNPCEIKGEMKVPRDRCDQHERALMGE